MSTTRLATARAALRAHLSPVMSRDHDERDRLCAEVDAAKAELDAAEFDAELFDFGAPLQRRTRRGSGIARTA